MLLQSLVPPVLALACGPLMVGVLNRTKARFGGRSGPPLLQPYRDIWKLLQKGAAYSRTTTWIFRAGPIISLATIIIASWMVPLGDCDAPLSFSGDLLVFVYLLGLGRLFTVFAALDTGSAFEGMGASREVIFSALTEPALLLGLAAVAKETGNLSLTSMHSALTFGLWSHAGLTLALVTVVLLIVLLTENSRIPVDDPNTHLELTMIHEVMVLDHGGFDLAYVQYAHALKLWVVAALLVGLVVPASGGFFVIDLVADLAAMFGLAVVIGAIESTMGRLRMMRVPQLLVGATALSGLALILEYKGF